VNTTTQEYLRIVGVNQLGVFLGMRTAIPVMTTAGRASIVNISSTEGIGGTLAFGHGVHFCLGAALARMEGNSSFTEPPPRPKSIELSGEPQLIATTFVGGLKHLPIRYALT
jgi:NAD(P)-dependent dehydrogenase (short-subunit alcohol dehydrogenase family)